MFTKKLCSNDFIQINYIGKTYNQCATYLFEFEVLQPDKITITFDFPDKVTKIMRLIVLDDRGRVLKKFDRMGSMVNQNLQYRKFNEYDHTTISVRRGRYKIKYWTDSDSDEIYHLNIKSNKNDVINPRSDHCLRQNNYHENGIPLITPFNNKKLANKKSDSDSHVDHDNKRTHFKAIKTN